MQMGRDQLSSLELVERVLLDIFPKRRAAGGGALRHERQLEYFRFDEAAGLIGRDRPDNVGDAVARLIEELRRCAAQLHRRIDLALQAAVRFLVDLLAPRVEELRLDRRLRRQKVMDLQNDFLRDCAGGAKRSHARDE